MKIYEIDNSLDIKSLVNQKLKKDEYLRYIVEDGKISDFRHGGKTDYQYIIENDIIYDIKIKKDAEYMFEEGKIIRLDKVYTEEELDGMTDFRYPNDLSKQIPFEEFRKQGKDPYELIGESKARGRGRYLGMDSDKKWYRILDYKIVNNNQIYGIFRKETTDKEPIEKHFNTIENNILYAIKGINKLTKKPNREATHYIENTEDMSIEKITMILAVTDCLSSKSDIDNSGDIADDAVFAAKDIAKKGLNKLKGLFGKKK